MTTNPFYPDVTQHECREPGVILPCMGSFSRFCVRTVRCTAEEAMRPAREIVSASRLRQIDSTPTHHALTLLLTCRLLCLCRTLLRWRGGSRRRAWDFPEGH